jgi:hypothetical protein
VLRPVGVEKVLFSGNSEDLENRKCLGKLRRSFVGLPNAKFCRPFSDEGVFQQPRLIGTIIARTHNSHAAKTLHVADVCLDRRNCMVAEVDRVAVEHKSLVLPL